MTRIDIQAVRKEYRIGEYVVIALDDVDLAIPDNQFVAFRGASGAGKTTLLNIVASLDKPSSGKVLVDDIDIASMSEHALIPWRAVNVGFVFQSFNLISTLTALENVSFPALFWGDEAGQIETRARELLGMVGMGDRDDHLPVQLSAGEQQRVALARALINDPSMILADEPTANLDDATARLIASVFENLKKEGGKTIIVASHDDRLLNVADVVHVISAGRITGRS